MFLSTIKAVLVVFSTVVLCKFGNVVGQEQHHCIPVAVVVSQPDETSIVGSTIGTNQTILEFYNFNGVSFRGQLPTGPNTSLIALHQDTSQCDISLVVVHSQAGSGAAFGWGRMQFQGVDLSSPTIKDDTETFLLSDRYEYNALTDTSTVIWNWGTCCSDGLAHLLGPNWEGCFDVEATFSSQSIQKWLFVSGATRTTSELKLGATLTVCAKLATPKPSQEPSKAPSLHPTLFPSSSPSNTPSNTPSSLPTLMPSVSPSREPSIVPTAFPSSVPSHKPTLKPTFSPTTIQPSTLPPKQHAPKNQSKIPATRRPTIAPRHQPVTKASPSPTSTKLGQDSTVTLSTKAPSLMPIVLTTTEPTLAQEDERCADPNNCPMWNLSCLFHYFLACGLF